MFKIKDGYKPELQMSETVKLFGSINKIIDKTKNGENVSSLEVVEVVLVQCNLVDNQRYMYYTLLDLINLMLIC